LPARALCLLLACAAPALARNAAAGYEAGDSTVSVDALGTPIELYVYKPAAYRGEGLVVSLHGLARNAPGYRDHTRALADELRALLVVPLFDRMRFPTWRYQRAGIARRDPATGALHVEPAERRTGELLRAIVDAVRTEERAPSMPYVLIGHSAGAQFLLRATAFGRLEPARIVVANPSSWLAPSAAEPFPYGFGGLPHEMAGEDVIRRYLARPVSVLLGTADTGSVDLSMAAGARRQGEHRYARGTNVFDAAAATARSHGWTFGWRRLEIPGVGHSARAMYASPIALRAVCPDSMEGSARGDKESAQPWPCVGKAPTPARAP